METTMTGYMGFRVYGVGFRDEGMEKIRTTLEIHSFTPLLTGV